jgi:hypothetical protein
MNSMSKHDNWQKHWQLDVENARAIHESGWSVKYFPEAALHADVAKSCLGGLCCAKDGSRWAVIYEGTFEDFSQWLLDQRERGLLNMASANDHVSRLMCEAGELWTCRSRKPTGAACFAATRLAASTRSGS